MRYTSPKSTKTKSNNRRSIINKMSIHYEKRSRELNLNALDAAGFEVAYYTQMVHGRTCTCINNLSINTILDDEGNLSEPVMDNLLDDKFSPYDNLEKTLSDSRFRGLSDYANISDNIAEFDTLADDFDANVITTVTNRDELESMSVFDDDGSRAFSASVANCSVCNRTGFVGGYNLFGGFRKVFDVRDFFQMENCVIDIETAPYSIKPINDQESFSFFLSVTLPKKLRQLLGLRLMNGYKPISLFKYSMDVVETNTNLVFINLQTANRFLNGTKYNWKITIEPTAKITHFEVLGLLNSKKTLIDISNFSRNPSSKSFNDIDSISLSLPATLGQMRVRDIFMDKNTRTEWIVTSAEIYASSHTVHGFLGTAERIKFRQEPYSLLNPYLFGYKEKI